MPHRREFKIAILLGLLAAGPGTAIAEERWPTKRVMAEGMPAQLIQDFFHSSPLIETTTRGLVRRDWLEALETPGFDGKNLWENREFYGFVNDPQDPDKMPVGFAWAGDYLVDNCAACHTSFIEHKGELLLYPGGTNRKAAGGGVSAYLAIADTIVNPRKFGRFAKEILGPDATRAARQELRQQMVDATNSYVTTTFSALASKQFSGYKEFLALNIVGDLLSRIQDEGIGRGGHPFVVGQNLWMGEQNFETMAGPVDIPYIYEIEHLDKLHYNGNTNSVLERNIISLLNTVVPPTFDELLVDVDPRAMNTAEKVSAEFEPPSWPEEIFGSIDRDMAARGESLYQSNCSACHAADVTERLNIQQYPEAEIGTDTAYFDHLKKPMKGLFGKEEQSYQEALVTAMAGFKAYWYPLYDVTEAEATEFDPNPYWDFQEVWTGRPLTGIWSTAPFLHNGSVPTLYHLLLPSDQRPTSYTGGSVVMDVDYVGNQWDKEPSLADGTYTYDGTAYGQTPIGHDYGTALSDSDRMDLLEYLKTI